MLHFIDETNRDDPAYADMIEQQYRIRHDIYVNWRGWKGLERPDGREIDQFDNEDAKYVIWADGAEVVGGARFVPTTKPHLMSEVFPHIVTLGEIPRHPNVWELTRIFTSRTGKSKVNRRGVTLEVFAALFEVGLHFNLKAISVVCDTFFLPRLLACPRRTLKAFASPSPFRCRSTSLPPLVATTAVSCCTISTRQCATPHPCTRRWRNMPNEDVSRPRHLGGEQAPDSQAPPAEAPAHRQRGPYRIGEVTRDQELLRDPEVSAFAQAVVRIEDPRARAHLAWLVHELARTKKRAEPQVGTTGR